MMEFYARTPDGQCISLDLWEYLALFEHRLTLNQIMLRKELMCKNR